MGKFADVLKKHKDEQQKHRKEVELPPLDVDEVASSPVAQPNKAAAVASLVERWDERCQAVCTQFPAIAESLRRVRAKLLHPDNGEPAHSVLITSAGQGEGKSFVCANLGVIMAQGVGRHALLLDCDLRRPTLASLFGAANDSGLVNYLRDGAPLPELIVSAGMPRLSLLPGGKPPINPAELLTSDKMVALLAELQGRYDDRLILVDSPPVHAASETAVLAKSVDKVIVVVRWGSEAREHIQKMVEILGPEKIVGVVFNDFRATILDKTSSGDGYYNYYAQNY